MLVISSADFLESSNMNSSINQSNSMKLSRHNGTALFQFNEAGLNPLHSACNGLFVSNDCKVQKIWGTSDGKAEFVVCNDGRVISYVHSQMGYPAMYPLLSCTIEKPVKAVLMDLDGTSVKSEEFWIWIIQRTIAALLEDSKFELEQADMPFVSGHSVSEHLQYCIRKYCPEKTVEQARELYFEITGCEMKAVLDGTGRADAFKPTEGLKDFLLTLKSNKIKIGLVTSGLFEKAWPEIYAAFKQLQMGDPREFYDAIITAGHAIRRGQVGTLGELEPKPHPWLYAETGCVGLGINFNDRSRVVGIEDSGAGVISVRLAGFACLGLSGGNIEQSGTKGLCSQYCNSLGEMLAHIL